MTTIDQAANDILAQQTCGYSGCFNTPEWLLQIVRIQTADGGECELAGFRDDPINRVCQEHHDDKATAMMIANKAWGIVLRSIEQDNPGMLAQIGKKFRMKHFDIAWKKIG